ncbi:hypothetical protein OH764_23495 [Burkholderia sp. M6-3]|jgi:hypothetical protein
MSLPLAPAGAVRRSPTTHSSTASADSRRAMRGRIFPEKAQFIRAARWHDDLSGLSKIFPTKSPFSE